MIYPVALHRLALPLALLTFGSVIVACGDDDAQLQASWTPETTSAEATSNGASQNSVPEINSIRFEPADASPGRMLRAFVEASDSDHEPIELGYTWTINGRRTASSGAAFNVPADLQRGDRIEVSVIASDDHSNSVPTSHMVRIGNRAPSLQGIQIHVREDADGGMGHWVADPEAQDPDGDRITFRYAWFVNEEQLDADTEELDRATRKRGDEVRLVVWATDGNSESAPLKSAPFTISNSPPDINSRPPGVDPSGQFVYAVTASDRDGDRGLRYSLEQGPSGMTIDNFSGEVRWQATAQNAGEHMVKIAVDDRHGGVTKQTFYVQVATGPASRR